MGVDRSHRAFVVRAIRVMIGSGAALAVLVVVLVLLSCAGPPHPSPQCGVQNYPCP